MEAEINTRLQELRREFQTGQEMLAELEQRAAALRETLWRLSGAIQVLEELLARRQQAEAPGAGISAIGAGRR